MFDWFTLFAQLVNFLVLVWLLKRFLYKPILRAIDEREKHISTQLKDAEKNKTDAQKLLEDYQYKNKEFDQHRQTLLNNAISEVDSERQKLLEQTRTEIETLRLRLHETIRDEQQNLSTEIMRRTQTEVFAVARKALSDLASVTLEEQMADVFINRLKELKPEEKELLLSALTKTTNKAIVRSTFEISSAKQNIILLAMKTTLKTDAEIKFETAPHLVSGIEFVAGGYKLDWSIRDYLVSLEANLADLLKENVKT